MDKKEFNNLKVSEQVENINSRLKEGVSFRKVCKEIDINHSTVLTRFKRANYVFNDDEKQYILQSMEVKAEPTDTPKESEKTIKDINTPLEFEKEIQEPKRGRPQKHKEGEKLKITFEVDNKIIKALKLKKVLENITLNSYIEQLLLSNIEEKYFDMVER